MLLLFSGLMVLLDNLLHHFLRHFFIVGELSGEAAASLRLGAEIGGIFIEFGGGDLGFDFAHVAATAFDALDPGPLGIQLPHDLAHKIFRRGDRNVVDGL